MSILRDVYKTGVHDLGARYDIFIMIHNISEQIATTFLYDPGALYRYDKREINDEKGDKSAVA